MRRIRSPAAPERSRIYEKIISDLLHERAYELIAELVADTKERCARLRIPYEHHEIDEALTVMRERLQREVVTPPAPGRSELAPTPLTRDEAAAILARLKVAPKVVPMVRELTPREADRRAAARVVAQAILDAVARCEDVE